MEGQNPLTCHLTAILLSAPPYFYGGHAPFTYIYIHEPADLSSLLHLPPFVLLGHTSPAS